MVPRAGREAQAQGGVAYLESWRLWSGGHVRYVVDTVGSTGNVAPLVKDEGRLLSALREWEEKTCIRFTECADEASCQLPYVRFHAHQSYCNSYIGALTSQVNVINLSPGCGMGAVVHEIGHALGMTHEQSRRDRDEYVAVDYSHVAEGVRGNFEKNARGGRDVGPYDYASIMHYSADAFAPGKTVIVSPYPIGQRSGLSDGDVATIQYIYNGCSASYAAPTCIASVEVGKTHVIPHSREWTMDFNAQYSTPMSVSHGGDVPEGTAVYSNVVGRRYRGSDWAVRYEEVRFTPTAAHAGKTYTISATFTADETSVTCAVQVRVADSDTVCFGLGASDPGVCSGRGKCVADPLAPCVCDEGYGGLDCSGFANCPSNTVYSFDEGMGTWIPQAAASVTTDFFAAGGGSLKVGEVGSQSQGVSFVNLVEASQPSRITLHTAAMGGSVSSPTLSFRDASNSECFSISRYSGTWYFQGWTGASFATDVFHFVELDLDWGSQRATLMVDGKVVKQGAQFRNACATGVKTLAYFGNGWLDEINLWCKVPAPTTSAPATPTPVTPVPKTSAPATSAPKTSAPATSAPPTPAPKTSAPATPAPATPAPKTSAPATSAPPTPAPKTPETLAPKTSAPATPVTPTPKTPTTSAPATPAPLTSAPATEAPKTQAPATPAPKTAAPKTPVPATPVPKTPVPKTAAPKTPVPVTPVPKTPVPKTPAPATPAPKECCRFYLWGVCWRRC
eukprot:TRINITY_DN1027_c0_g1_i12.p1 TRINITY_DN1027_c0_g1~~TRINITY_DN1027_c0_g1_i12.p1  ORF type:complete len:763 (+),score=246.90 TRINITY_DN1027_c0_g1_i12:91-2289(+)